MKQSRKLACNFNTLERENRFRCPDQKTFDCPALLEAVEPHISSFNEIPVLLREAASDIGVKTIVDTQGNKLELWIEDITISRPTISPHDTTTLERRLFPSECRDRLASYRGKLSAQLLLRVNDGAITRESREFGQVPVMVRSNRCHLANATSAELVRRHEESEEIGGYFIVNGIERLIRLLILPRRNHTVALIRNSYAKRGPTYTIYGVQVRSVRRDESSLSLTLHYLSDGNVILRFSWRKNEYLVPVLMIMNALLDTSDKEVFAAISRGSTNSFISDRLELLLQTYHRCYGLYTCSETLAHLGGHFRVVLNASETLSDEEVGQHFLNKIILVHLDSPSEKFHFLAHMIQKLYALVAGECVADNPDAAQHQEILLGGSLYAVIIKERFEEYLHSIQAQLRSDILRMKVVNFNDRKYITKLLTKMNSDIGAKMQYFLSTGNLVSPTGLDLQQASGFTIIAEKINFLRYISHFRTVHRGAFFAELKTTTVRKLLPESWGFLCPVHTPDGSPCGLLNHLAHKCSVTTQRHAMTQLPKLLASFGISPISSTCVEHVSSVQLDGRILGYCTDALARHIAYMLRYLKVTNKHELPRDLEIGYVPVSNGGQFPGLFLFSGPARMTRPVQHCATGLLDLIGSFEQVYLDILCDENSFSDESNSLSCDLSKASPFKNSLPSHREYSPTYMLSIVANLTPFSDFNQSPRNMYQCQMGKQTMGTPGSSLVYRTDNKLYRLQTGQTPIVRPKLHSKYAMDSYPNGTNAIVAVISYTGYDMEDAMIINKSSHERGFAYGSISKSEIVDLTEHARNLGAGVQCHLGFGKESSTTSAFSRKKIAGLQEDGLPYIGSRLEQGDALTAFWDDATGKTHVQSYKGGETAYVEQVRILGNDAGDKECQVVHIKLRIPRSAVIGDKFSSRHGQKGVCSQKYPAVDMPFSESGMQPDVIINPHAFPSRMTIGMFVESLAGKAGALHGSAQDCTPWVFGDNDKSAVDYFGTQLLEAGFNYHGNEPMYSGILGTEFHADIYIGVVYYQRLRHMVNDKFQVRTTGPVDSLTHQPVKGRKRAGGIRFGEMERDSIIAHGTSFILQDRLMNCSDYTTASVCKTCGSILSVITAPTINGASITTTSPDRCRTCASGATGFEKNGEVWEDGFGKCWVGGENVTVVAIPYVFKYFAAELAAMGITMRVTVK